MNDRHRLVLSSPDHFLAAIPHFVGYMPEKSLVVACFEPNDNGRADTQLRVTARIDLPTPESDPLGTWGPNAAASIGETGTRSVLVAIVDADALPAAGTTWPHQDAIDNFITALEAQDIATLDVLYTDGTRRWSIGCTEESCCPAEGVEIDAEARTLVDAEFAFASNTPVVASRAQLIDETSAAEVDGVAERLERFVAERPGDEADEHTADKWRMAQIHVLHTIAAWPENMAEEDIANVTGALTDIQVRDTFLRDLAEPGSNTAGAIAMLQTATKGSPTPYVAPPAALLATLHYWNGDGARANVALDRASESGSDYSFAGLMRECVTRAMPPEAVRQMMLEIPREECFYGRARFNTMNGPTPAPAAPSVQPTPLDQGLAL